MSADTSMQAVVRRLFEEGWNTGSVESVRELVDDSYASNDEDFIRVAPSSMGAHDQLRGADAFAEHVRQYHNIYDNLQFAIEGMATVENTVITVCRMSGTTKHETFTDRSGRQRPFELIGQSVMVTAFAGSKVGRNDVFWPRIQLFP
jgi:SnoaL-like domain